MKKWVVLALGFIASVGYAQSLEAKLNELKNLGGYICAPEKIGMAEAYIGSYKGFKTYDEEEGEIKVIPISKVDQLIYKNKAKIALTEAERKIFSDVDGDGVPCYQEVKNGTNPYVPDYPKKVAKLEKETKKEEAKKIEKEVEKTKPKGFHPLLTQARIHFEFNKAEIKKEYMPYLNVISKYLKTHPNLKVKIVGYTDNVGSEKYNKILALKRAKALKEALVKFGVSPKRIEIIGKGKKDFLFNNKTDLNRFTNRRADFFILETK